MDFNQQKYKLFKSFRVSVQPEDKMQAKVQFELNGLTNIKVPVDNLNFEFITFSSSEKIPGNCEIEIELLRGGLIFKEKKSLYQRPRYTFQKEQSGRAPSLSAYDLYR